VYVLRPDGIRNGDLWGDRREQMLTGRDENFEIDDEFDLWLNEQILKRRTGCGGNRGEGNRF
jgi:hypothetical protein